MQVLRGRHGRWPCQRRSCQCLLRSVQQALSAAGAAQPWCIWRRVVHGWLEQRQLGCLEGLVQAV